MGPKPPRKPMKPTIIKKKGLGFSVNKYDFDPQRGHEQLLRDAQRKADFKKFYREETSRSRYKKAGGKISKYYKDGGMVITGRE